jgi:hypothetical protein
LHRHLAPWGPVPRDRSSAREALRGSHQPHLEASLLARSHFLRHTRDDSNLVPRGGRCHVDRREHLLCDIPRSDLWRRGSYLAGVVSSGISDAPTGVPGVGQWRHRAQRFCHSWEPQAIHCCLCHARPRVVVDVCSRVLGAVRTSPEVRRLVGDSRLHCCSR